MAGCSCSTDGCRCIELERKLEETQELADTYKLALERVCEFSGPRMGLYYGSDGLGKLRSIAREALSPRS